MQAIDGPEQPVRLAVDPVKKVKGIRTAIAATDPEADCPEAARAVGSNIDVDRPMELPVCPTKSVDLAMEIAKVADQQMVAEPGETGWRDGNSPWRSEAAANDQLFDEFPVLIEDRQGPRPQTGVDLVGAAGGRVGYVNLATNILCVEWDEPSRQGGVHECAGPEAQRSKGAVEDVDAARSRAISGIKPRLGAIDSQSGVDGRRGSLPG